ncbi:hypothetical protein EI94DRAFT_1703094 [Lactarius quietus]|nr:hypothetical protein EI94DRAFT_1703094 [Lactarius quietus]
MVPEDTQRCFPKMQYEEALRWRHSLAVANGRDEEPLDSRDKTQLEHLRWQSEDVRVSFGHYGGKLKLLITPVLGSPVWKIVIQNHPYFSLQLPADDTNLSVQNNFSHFVIRQDLSCLSSMVQAFII